MKTKTTRQLLPDWFIPVFLLATLCFLALGPGPSLLPAQEEGDAAAKAADVTPPADDEAEAEAADAAEVAGTTSLLDVYQQGGWMMHILLLCSIGTIAVIVYCFVQISPKKMVPRGLVDSMNRLMAQKDVENAYAITQENPSSYSKVVSAALLKVNFERDQANKGSMEAAAGETLDQEETKQMLWVNYLNVFATIAPMLGLLGTVMGMMQAFGDLSAGKSEPSDLAGGINKAMGTTAGGLLVGIPAMFFYFFFRNKLTAIVSEIQKNATFAVDVLSGEVQLAGSGGGGGGGEASQGESGDAGGGE